MPLAETRSASREPIELPALSEDAAARYAAATPFPHRVFDDFLPASAIDDALEEFPGPDDPRWSKFHHRNSKKLAICDETLLGSRTRELIRFLNSQSALTFLEKLTGIKGLIPDPYLAGGGLHCIASGGFLNIHADFNYYERLKLHRRLNALIYLNRDWRDEYQGHLELWTTDMSKCVHRIAPVAGRCVIFSTTDTAFHGHPEPLQTPAGVYRRSIALYYYSADRPESERSEPHSTLYQVRPGDQAPPRSLRDRAMDCVRELVPPIAMRAARALRQRLRGR